MSTELIKSPQDTEITESNTNKLDSDFQTENKRVRKTLADQIREFRSAMGSRWELLQTNQVIYMLALVLFIFLDTDLGEPNAGLWLIGLLAFFSMSRELWSIFIKVWESTLGRLVLIVLYASIANFTLAMAAQKVNQVIGVDPTYLFHTQGLTTLLILPMWLMIVSVVAMVFTFGVLQLLKLMTGIFILLRIIGKKKKAKEAFPKPFVVIRLVLLMPVIAVLGSSISWYSEQLNLPDTTGFNFSISLSDEQREQANIAGMAAIDEKLQNPDMSDEEKKELLTARQAIIEALAPKETSLIEPAETISQANIPNNDTTIASAQSELTEPQEPVTKEAEVVETEEVKTGVFLDKLIASFVYNYEAFQFSHCTKLPEERVVYVSEDQVLVAIQDASTYTGFSFTARDCKAN